eukprot:3453018-Rhodomonas_salina.1
MRCVNPVTLVVQTRKRQYTRVGIPTRVPGYPVPGYPGTDIPTHRTRVGIPRKEVEKSESRSQSTQYWQ